MSKASNPFAADYPIGRYQDNTIYELRNMYAALWEKLSTISDSKELQDSKTRLQESYHWATIAILLPKK